VLILRTFNFSPILSLSPLVAARSKLIDGAYKSARSSPNYRKRQNNLNSCKIKFSSSRRL